MGFIEKIRQSDNATKFRYVVIFTSIAGVFVIALWAMTVRGIVESATTPKNADDAKTVVSFIGRIGQAWGGIVDRTENTFKFFSEKAGETNEITVDKTNN